jgi:hypothetical protein
VRFRQWVAGVMEDHIVLDGVAVYPVTTVGGDVIGFRLVDATTMKLLINDLGERPQPPHPAFQQSVYGFPRGEYIADVVLNEDGTEDTSSLFTASQITYWRENFRTYTPYGFSQVEQALVSAALYLKRQGWMHAEYDEGSTPLTWLIPQGDKFVANQLSPAQRREYETAINDDLEGQTGKRHRIKVSYPGYEPQQMESVDERYKPEYDLFLLKLVASHLGVTLDRLGFTETKGLGATGQHERQKEVQDDSGVNPDAAMLTDLIMELSRNYLDCPLELVFEFSKNKAEDEAAKDEIWTSRRQRGAATLNEDRKANGMTPLDIPEADMPSMVTATGIVYIEGGADQQAAMNELAANPPAPGVPGSPGGGRPGPGGGGAGAGGSRPKPSGPKPTKPTQPAAPKNKAAAASEVAAYHRWVNKQAGKGVPARPFRFEHAEPDAFPVEMHDGRWMAFVGYEWRQDITKDWRSWNAEHPLHPRGPHGRFVKVGNLIDELKRVGGPISEHHENAFDEAVRRAHAGRHIKRGESQLADDLERRGLLEELGGPGGDKGRLSVSEAGRQHLLQRERGAQAAAEQRAVLAEHVPAGVPEPIDDPVDVARTRQERIDRARATAELAADIEEAHADSEGDPAIIARRAAQTAARNAGKSEDADLLAGTIAGHGDDADAMLALARSHAERAGLVRGSAPRTVEPYDPAAHALMPGEKIRPGQNVEIVRPGYHYTDPVTGESIKLHRAAVETPFTGPHAPEPAPVPEPPKRRKPNPDQMGMRTPEEMEARRARQAAAREASVAATGYTPAQREILADLEGRRADAAFEREIAPKSETPSERLDRVSRGDFTEAERAEHARIQRELDAMTSTAPPVHTPEAAHQDEVQPTVENAVGQTAEDRLRQAEIMYGSDRSKWQAHAKRDAARLERQAARKPKTTPIEPSTSGGQVTDSSGTVESMDIKLTRAQVDYLTALHEGRSPRATHGTRDALERRGLIDTEWTTVNGYQEGHKVITDAGRRALGVGSGEGAASPDASMPQGTGVGAGTPDAAPVRLTAAQAEMLAFYSGETNAQVGGRNSRGTVNALQRRGLVRPTPGREWQTEITDEGRAALAAHRGGASVKEAERHAIRKPRLTAAARAAKDAELKIEVDNLLGRMPTPEPPKGAGVTPESVEAFVRENANSIGYASMTELRSRIGGTREEQDRVLMQMARDRKIYLAPEDNQKMLTAEDRAAALDVGGEPKHAIRMRTPTAAAPPEPVKSGAERQLEMQTEHYQRMLAQAEELDTQINFAETDRERRQLEARREQLYQQMAALDRQIQAAKKAARRRKATG